MFTDDAHLGGGEADERAWPRASVVWSAGVTVSAGVALLISLYLTMASWVAGVEPAGCGAGSGCGAVLSSKWSSVLGFPVSGGAVLVYTGVLIMAWVVRSRSAAMRRWAWVGLMVMSGVIVTSAGWFVYLQLGVLEAVCPYCMADHAAGVVTATLIVWAAPLWRSEVSEEIDDVYATRGGLRGGMWAAALVGVAAAGGLISVQAMSPEPIARVGDGDWARMAGEGAGRVISVGTGDQRVTLSTADWPMLGDGQADRLAVMMADYACPHCRHTHEVVKGYLEQSGGGVGVMFVPVALNRQCNAHAPAEMSARFDETCELWRYSMAVWRAAPVAWEAYDAWLYETEQPRSAATARIEAERLIDPAQHAVAAGKPMSPEMRRLLDQSGAAQAAVSDRVPVLIVPGTAPVVGRVGSKADVQAIFKSFAETGGQSD